MEGGASAGARRLAFIRAAQKSFVKHGYAATTMSSVVAKVGGSKTTLWAYFGSKEELFNAVIDELVKRFGASMEIPIEHDLPLEQALRKFAETMMAIVLSDEVIALQRVVIDEAGRFPELGKLYYQRASGWDRARLAEYFETAIADRRLAPSDPVHATAQFILLCQSVSHQAYLVAATDRPSPGIIQRDIDMAIATFLRGRDSDGAPTKPVQA